MSIGIKLHHFAQPRPPKPDFDLVIPSRLSTCGGSFKLIFYLPESYQQCKDHDSSKGNRHSHNHKYPVVINFHGGGFTLGTAIDDARWARAIIRDVNAIFVSVEYRLAPEYPFSVGIEDGTDAVIYLATHAEELLVDPHRIALSGFSAGGNFAFTVPLLLHDLQNDKGKRILAQEGSAQYVSDSNSSSCHTHLSISPSNQSFLGLDLRSDSPLIGSISKYPALGSITQLKSSKIMPDLSLCCLISFYPSVDYRISREKKRQSNPMPAKNLPSTLTRLFDESYIQSHETDLADPYLSPNASSDAILRAAYPDDIILYTCEYDMLNAEGVAFGKRLSSKNIGKRVHGGIILEASHAFDKTPNPVRFSEKAERCYREACAELKKVFGDAMNTSSLVKNREDE